MGSMGSPGLDSCTGELRDEGAAVVIAAVRVLREAPKLKNLPIYYFFHHACRNFTQTWRTDTIPLLANLLQSTNFNGNSRTPKDESLNPLTHP